MFKQTGFKGALGKALAVVGGLGVVGIALADEQFPVLKAGKETYTNVTATDIYFTYPGGMGNAKLKNLDAALRRHFHFDAEKAAAMDRDRADMNEACRQFLILRETPKPAAKEKDPDPGADIEVTTGSDGDPVLSKLFASSFRGRRPPQIVVDEWLTPPPEIEGKFVLVVIWRSTASSCLKAIPHLNELADRFKDRLAAIGLSDETADDVRKLQGPKPNFPYGVDPQGRTKRALGVFGIPHSILIDPKGTVRFEGVPLYLEADDLERLMDKYGK